MFKKGQHGVEWWRAGRRRCSGCESYYEPVAFANRANGGPTGDGLDIYCRDCRKAANRRSYQRHREQDIAETLAWRAKHPARYRRYQRDYSRERKSVARLLAARAGKEARHV